MMVLVSVIFLCANRTANHCASGTSDHSTNGSLVVAVANRGTNGGADDASQDRPTTTMTIELRICFAHEEANEEDSKNRTFTHGKHLIKRVQRKSTL